ncbi:MAG: M23 family metallopeptidase [Leptolinea sp.]|nr:M23 family metallopeptidase [Leptolinea sp.]
MKKILFTDSLLLITITMLFVRLFVIIVLIAWFISNYYYQETPSITIPEPTQSTPVVVIPLDVSPEDAVVANSEWAGALTKIPFVEPTVFVIPTRIPTETVDPTVESNTTAVLVRPTEVVIHSPLDGFSINDLSGLISQEFKAPPPGEDTGHHGVDFAFWNRENKPILGVPILAAFPGKVSMSGQGEKPPYGYAIMIETPIESLPQNIIQAIKIPPQPIGATINNKLNCPDLTHDQWNSSSKSLYTLYGHLIQPAPFKNGDIIESGQTLGYVGNSGYSSAPHLHLEMRLGPSGAAFNNMGHYDPITTDEDRHNYCNWRISGVFQLFDPMDLYEVILE